MLAALVLFPVERKVQPRTGNSRAAAESSPVLDRSSGARSCWAGTGTGHCPGHICCCELLRCHSHREHISLHWTDQSDLRHSDHIRDRQPGGHTDTSQFEHRTDQCCPEDDSHRAGSRADRPASVRSVPVYSGHSVGPLRLLYTDTAPSVRHTDLQTLSPEGSSHTGCRRQGRRVPSAGPGR